MALRHGTMGEVNAHLVLAYFRDHPRTTRPEIAADLDLSPASVSRIVTRLVARGLIEESGDTSGSGGRPRSVLTLNASSECVVGIDLGGTKCHGAMSGLDGQVRAEQYVTVAEAGGAFEALERVWSTMLAAARAEGKEPAALAVGVPAVIDPDSELAVRGPNVGWDGFDLVARVREFGVPFVVDNDVNLAAIAEGEVGKATGCRDYAVLSIGTGLGGAVVANGHLVRGRHNAAGEIGAMLPETRMLGDRRAAGIGGLESILSGAAIAQRARSLVVSEPDAMRELGATPTAREVIVAGLAGQRHAAGLLGDAVRALAQAIVTIAAVTDPEVVVIDGSVGRALAPMFGEVEALVARHIATPPRLEASELGPNSTVRGALSGALGLFWAGTAPAVLEELAAEGGASA